MTDCILETLVVLLAGIVGSAVVQAHPPAALMHDSGVGAICFACHTEGFGNMLTMFTYANPLRATPQSSESKTSC
jgi:hypothetical protein